VLFYFSFDRYFQALKVVRQMYFACSVDEGQGGPANCILNINWRGLWTLGFLTYIIYYGGSFLLYNLYFLSYIISIKFGINICLRNIYIQRLIYTMKH
jgi:hypothetical protein